MQLFPISCVVEGRGQVAPDTVVVPMIGRSFPTEAFVGVSCQIADREPIDQSSSKGRVAAPLTPARRLEWVKIVLPDLCVGSNERWCGFRIVEIFLKVVRRHAIIVALER